MNCDLVEKDGVLAAKVLLTIVFHKYLFPSITQVWYQGEERVFTFVQLCAMYFSKLKEITENETKVPMTDCVISIPNYYTDDQRRAILDAGDIAGINILRLMPDTTAAALQWGIPKSDLPEEEPRYVVFVDMGHSDMTVSVVAFQKGKMMVRNVRVCTSFISFLRAIIINRYGIYSHICVFSF
jgi:heat shock protein 4